MNQLDPMFAQRHTWLPDPGVLVPGPLPTHEDQVARARARLWIALILATVAFVIMLMMTLLEMPKEAPYVLAPLLPAYSLAATLFVGVKRRAQRRSELSLAVEVDSVSFMRDGQRHEVPWRAVHSVKEHIFPGRFSFRGARGEELFSIDVVVAEDARMAKAVAAAAHAGRLSPEGCRAYVPIGASEEWSDLLILGAFLMLAAGIAAMPGDSSPPLSDLEHHHGTVNSIDSLGKCCAQLQLTWSDFQYFVVRKPDRAQRVYADVEVGDQVDLWCDRAERPAGPIGAIYQLDVNGKRILDHAEETAQQRAEWNEAKPIVASIAALGLLCIVASLAAQARRAVVKLQA